MLETRIVCKNLPKVLYYPSEIIGKMDNPTKMKVHQEQREYLMKDIERFELDIEQHEFAYQKEWYRLEHGWSQASVNTEIFNRCLSTYLNFWTESGKTTYSLSRRMAENEIELSLTSTQINCTMAKKCVSTSDH